MSLFGTLGSIAGGVGGFLVGGPVGAAAGMSIGGALGGLADKKNPEQQTPETIMGQSIFSSKNGQGYSANGVKNMVSIFNS